MPGCRVFDAEGFDSLLRGRSIVVTRVSLSPIPSKTGRKTGIDAKGRKKTIKQYKGLLIWFVMRSSTSTR